MTTNISAKGETMTTKSDQLRALLEQGSTVAVAARTVGAHYSFAHAVATKWKKAKAAAEAEQKGRLKKPRGITVRKLSGEADPTLAPVKSPRMKTETPTLATLDGATRAGRARMKRNGPPAMFD